MLPKGSGALKALKPLSKGSSLSRFKDYKAENPEGRWPTGLTPEARPFRSSWWHADKNYSVPYTIYNVPNNSEAYFKWPTLKKFMPSLNPRPWRSIKAGGSVGDRLETVVPGPTRDARLERQHALMGYMYNDLGVLVYDGPTEAQLQKIGDVLEEIVRHEGRLQIRAWHSSTKKVRFDKWNVYRLSVDESRHIDPLWRERGFLLPSGLDELTDLALQKWREDWKAGREAEGSDGRLPVRFVEDTKELWLLKNEDGMGLINDTINGPRISSVDAYVATGLSWKRICVNIELHTVGTKRFLGCANFVFGLNIDNDILKQRLEEVKELNHTSLDTAESLMQARKEEQRVLRHSLQNIYNDEAPASIEKHEHVVIDMTRKLWRLERLIWGQRQEIMRKEAQEKKMIEWKRQRELRKSMKAQLKADAKRLESVEKLQDVKEAEPQSEDDVAKDVHDEKST